LNPGTGDNRFRLSAHCANEPQRQVKSSVLAIFPLTSDQIRAQIWPNGARGGPRPRSSVMRSGETAENQMSEQTCLYQPCTALFVFTIFDRFDFPTFKHIMCCLSGCLRCLCALHWEHIWPTYVVYYLCDDCFCCSIAVLNARN